MAGDVARGVREVRGGHAPRVRVDRARAVHDFCWDGDGVAWPEPDINEIGGALHRVPTNGKIPGVRRLALHLLPVGGKRSE